MSFDFREEAAAGSRGAGVEQRVATAARARGVTPGGHGVLEQGGRAARLEWLRSCTAVVESSRQRVRYRRAPGRDLRGDALRRAERNKTRKQRLSQVFGALSLLRHGAHRAVRAARTRETRARPHTKQPPRTRTCAAQPEHRKAP